HPAPPPGREGEVSTVGDAGRLGVQPGRGDRGRVVDTERQADVEPHPVVLDVDLAHHEPDPDRKAEPWNPALHDLAGRDRAGWRYPDLFEVAEVGPLRVAPAVHEDRP